MTFEEEMLSCTPVLKRLAWRFVRNAADAEELVQATFCRALDKRRMFTPGTNLAGWLTVILKNEFYGGYRHRKRMQEDPDSLIANAVIEAASDTVDVCEEARAVRQAWPRLNPRYRDLLGDLIEGLQYDEIAARRGMPIGSVKSTIHRARLALREAVDG